MTNNYDLNALVTELAQDVRPVSPIWSPAKRAALWIPACFLITAFFVHITGDLRPEVLTQLSESPRFAIETALGFIAAIVAAFFAFEMAVPGKNWTPWLKFFSIAPFMAFVAMLLYSVVYPPVVESWAGWRFGCEREIMLFGLIPMLVFLYLGKRAAVLDKSWTGMLIAIASVTPAAAAMQLACMYFFWHTLVFHLAPVLLMAYLGAKVARRVFDV